jgi:hypothetical protein
MHLPLYESLRRVTNCCLQLTSEAVLATCGVNVITFFFLQTVVFCTPVTSSVDYLLLRPSNVLPHNPLISSSECMSDVVQTPGKEHYLQNLCIGVHPRHLCSGVSERRICSPEVGTVLYNQTNMRHVRSDRGKVQKILVVVLGVPNGIRTWYCTVHPYCKGYCQSQLSRSS